jgi:uncharacterized protein (TIGR00730 family)
MKKIAVFCSANNNIDPVFFEKTKELGKWIGENGHTLVFGGCDMGLMECLAKAVHEAGGQTIGVVPTKIEENGHVSNYVDIEIPCNNLSDRKDLMLAQSDVFIAFPGGIGTLDEIFTIAAGATIGYHKKKVILYNIGGFWDTLISLLKEMEQKSFMRESYTRHIVSADDLNSLSSYL